MTAPPAPGPESWKKIVETAIQGIWSPDGRRSAREGGPARSVFFVRDNGVGFDMRDAEAGFPGPGIGLAATQRILQRHGGSTWADATPGQGATLSSTVGGRNA